MYEMTIIEGSGIDFMKKAMSLLDEHMLSKLLAHCMICNRLRPVSSLALETKHPTTDSKLQDGVYNLTLKEEWRIRCRDLDECSAAALQLG